MTSRGTANSKDAFTSDVDIIKKGAPQKRIDEYNKKVMAARDEIKIRLNDHGITSFGEKGNYTDKIHTTPKLPKPFQPNHYP